MTDFPHLQGTEWQRVAEHFSGPLVKDHDAIPVKQARKILTALNDAYGQLEAKENLLKMGSEIIKAKDARIAELENELKNCDEDY